MKRSILLLIHFTSTALLGQDQNWLMRKDSLFQLANSEHFNIYYYTNTLNHSQLIDLIDSRELAYDSISNFFKLTTDLTTNLFLFPTEKIKIGITGHRGHGWAFENNIAEVFNDSIRVDPYHELVHRLGYSISIPPAMIDEGLAVYLSHKFADKPFSKTLGFPNKSINQILHIKTADHNLIEISQLYSFDEIDEADNIPLAYCQSASFIEYLITNYGKEKFLELFVSYSELSKEDYRLSFFQHYGKNIEDVGNDWLKHTQLD